jgi:transposase
MPQQVYEWLVGIDWAVDVHQVCLMDHAGHRRLERAVKHTADEVHDFVEWLLAQTGSEPSRIAVAIETPRGTLIDTLIERGFPVFAINPKQLDRFRDRFTVAGAKDDRRDALVLADSLRTDAHAFQQVRVDDALIVQLRELSRMEEDLQTDLTRTTNRLREQVYRVHPALLTLCPAGDEAWFWTLIEQAATPADRARLTATEVKTILRTHRIRRLAAPAVLAAVHASSFYTAPGVVEAAKRQIDSLVERVRFVAGQHRRGAAEIEAILEQLRTREEPTAEPAEHRDIEILESLPGVGRIITATMLTEASWPLADRDYSTLRGCAGVAPVTRRSGKRRRPLVQMRRACSPRLRQAAYHWGRVSVQKDPASRAYYDQLRGRGHGHGRALRSVVDRWLRILTSMLRHRSLYDPTRFLPATAIATP